MTTNQATRVALIVGSQPPSQILEPHVMPCQCPDPKLLSDAQLIRACAENGNDASCWLEFVERFQSLLARSAVRAYRRFTRGGFPAHWRVAEFVQETYLRLLRNDRDLLRRLRGETESAAKAYLTNIALNTVGDLLREEFAQKRHSEMTSLEDALPGRLSALAKEFAIPEGIADRDLLKLLTNHSTASHVSRDVAIFLLHVRVGLTAEEIAEADFIQLKPASVTSILIRTRNRLKKALEKAA